MGGLSLEFLDSVLVWTMWITLIAGAISVTGAFASGFIGYEIAAIVKRESDLKIAEANARAAEANKKAEEERLARMQLGAAVGPRSLSFEQQTSITLLWRPFIGRKVRVISYTLDAEGASFGAQIIGCLKFAGIKVSDGRASMLPTSGFISGIQVEGADEILVNTIVSALAITGHLKVSKGSSELRAADVLTGIAAAPASAYDASILIGMKPIIMIRQATVRQDE